MSHKLPTFGLLINLTRWKMKKKKTHRSLINYYNFFPNEFPYFDFYLIDLLTRGLPRDVPS